MARLDAKWFDFWNRGQTWDHFWQDASAASGSITGTGSVAQTYVIAATGTEVLAGTGSVAEGYALAATAAETFSATGSVAEPYALASSGTETFVGSGAAAETYQLTASGTESYEATGAVATATALSGSGIEGFEATGAVAVALALSAAGAEEFAGTASQDLTVVLDGVGAQGNGIIGTGDVALTAQIAATGSEVAPAPPAPTPPIAGGMIRTHSPYFIRPIRVAIPQVEPEQLPQVRIAGSGSVRVDMTLAATGTVAESEDWLLGITARDDDLLLAA